MVGGGAGGCGTVNKFVSKFREGEVCVIGQSQFFSPDPPLHLESEIISSECFTSQILLVNTSISQCGPLSVSSSAVLVRLVVSGDDGNVGNSGW